MNLPDGRLVRSAHILTIDCNGFALFSERQDGKGFEIQGGNPEEAKDQDWLDTARREFMEEIAPEHWNIDDLTLGGSVLVPSKKFEGVYPLVVYLSEVPFGTVLNGDRYRSVCSTFKSDEVIGVRIAPWNNLPEKLINFQRVVFIPALDGLLANLPACAKSLLTPVGHEVIMDGINRRAVKPLWEAD